MIRVLALCLALAAGAAWACPPPSAALLFHSCWGLARADVILLPDDPLPPPDAGISLAVTGAYTGRDSRDAGLPNPVGLFVHGGEVVNPTLARMDGVLIVNPGGGLSLHHRKRVHIGPDRYDLTDPPARRIFAEVAAAAGASVLQSHLLIVDGRLDVRDLPGQPLFRRRILFTDGLGFGLYQTAGAVTLHDAGAALALAHAPGMALNLDMGSYDYCWLTRAGTARSCGLLGRQDTDGLSNLLHLSLAP